VYVNGKIITADKAFSIAQAVAVKEGKFVGVGTSDAARRHTWRFRAGSRCRSEGE